MNRVKSEQLGMSHSTANGQLRKMIMFDLVKKAGLDDCFQCKEKINDIGNFSIEHKTPWLHSENPRELFFDLDNIAFSHHDCNTANARKPERKRKCAEQLDRLKSKSGFIGVEYYENNKKPYRARIRIDGKSKSLGYYNTAEECAKVVDNALVEAYGNDVVTNESLGLL